MQPVTVRQAAILVGPAVDGANTPSPLLACGDRPFLAWQLRELLRFGVSEILLLASHRSAALDAALPGIVAGLPRPVSVTWSLTPKQAGTGDALVQARALLQERFLLCNGHVILDFNIARLLIEPARSAIVMRAVRERGRVVYAGLSLLQRDDVLPLLTGAASLEDDALPALAAAGCSTTTVADGMAFDLDEPDGVAKAASILPQVFRRPALFLDRDGTINVDHGWVGTRQRWAWIPGAEAAIRLATERGWHVFVVTNQSGIARGHYDEPALAALHSWMTDELRRAGGTVDDIRFCPFHADAVAAQYRQAAHPWRKPAPGMLLDLIARWELDPARCVMIGDQHGDMQAAAAAGVRGVPFDGVNLRATVEAMLT